MARSKSTTRDPLVDEVTKRWEESDRALYRDRHNHWLSQAFYIGEQWLWWDNARDVVQSLPMGGAEKDRLRATVNLIKPNVEILLGKLLSTDMHFEVPSSSSDDSARTGAALAEFLLESYRVERDWEDVREQEVINAMFSGTSAVGVDWDPNLEVTLADGKKAKGDISLSALSIAEFGLQPGSREARDALWWVRGTAVPTQQAQAHYNLAEEPAADAHTDSGPLQRRMVTSRWSNAEIELCNVLTLYERPNPQCKKGRVVTIVGGDVVEKHDWPFPFDDRLNLYVFRQQKVSSRWTGETLMNAARSIQLYYNAIESIILEHARQAANVRLMVPYGAFDSEQELTDEPGEVVNYYPDPSGARPEYMQPAQVGRWLFNERDVQRQELDTVMHVTDVMRGVAPGDRNSGLALSVLAEGGETPLGRMARDQAKGWSEIASMALRILEAKVTNKRSATVVVEALDTTVPVSKRWIGSDLRGQVTAKMPTDNAMPTSKSQRQAWVLNLVDRDLLPKNPLLLSKILQTGGVTAFTELVDADASKAIRENHLMHNGEVMIPEPFDDHKTHMAEHNSFRKSEAYRLAPPEVQEIFDLHIDAHENEEAEQAANSAGLNAVLPGLGAIPQGAEPSGSALPLPVSEQQQQMAPPMGAPT